jgi:hypothetical protein
MREMELARSKFALLLIGGLFTAGCVNAHPSNREGATRDIPRDARVVAEGAPPLSFLFTGGGAVYVYDQTTDTLVHTARLPAQQGATVAGVISIDPDKRALVGRSAEGTNDELVLAHPLDPSHRLTMWFAPDKQAHAQDAADHEEHEEMKAATPATAPTSADHGHASSREQDR